MPVTSQVGPDDLRVVPALAELPDDELERFLAHGELREYADGEHLFHEGRPARALYLLLEGAVRIHRSLADGKRADLALLERGSIIGEVALLARSERNAAGSAEGPVRVLRIERAPILEAYQDGRLYARTLMFGISVLLAQRLESMNLRHLEQIDRTRQPDSEVMDFKRKILTDWAV